MTLPPCKRTVRQLHDDAADVCVGAVEGPRGQAGRHPFVLSPALINPAADLCHAWKKNNAVCYKAPLEVIRKSLLCFVLNRGCFVRRHLHKGVGRDEDSQMRRLTAAFRDLNFGVLLSAFLLSHRQHLSNTV